MDDLKAVCVLTLSDLVIRSKHLMALCPCAAGKNILAIYWLSVFCFREKNKISTFCSPVIPVAMLEEICCLPL